MCCPTGTWWEPISSARSPYVVQAPNGRAASAACKRLQSRPPGYCKPGDEKWQKPKHGYPMGSQCQVRVVDQLASRSLRTRLLQAGALLVGLRLVVVRGEQRCT